MVRIRILICVFATTCLSVSSQDLDYRWLNKIYGRPHAGWDKAMKDLSFSVYMIEPIPPVAISLQGYFTKDKEMLWNGYKSAIALSSALAISTTMKYTIRRERPYQKYAGTIINRDHTDTPSFPSGHTTAAFATATSLSLTYRKWYVTVPAYLYAGMAAYSRMRLGMHYPSDVAFGMFLGTGMSVLTWHVEKRIRQKKIRPLPVEELNNPSGY